MATTTFNTGSTVFALTTDRAESSYGIPVLVIGDAVYKPGDSIPPAAGDPFAFAGAQSAIQFVNAGIAHDERRRAREEFGSVHDTEDEQMAAYRLAHGHEYPEMARLFTQSRA